MATVSELRDMTQALRSELSARPKPSRTKAPVPQADAPDLSLDMLTDALKTLPEDFEALQKNHPGLVLVLAFAAGYLTARVLR